jgi:hypothetical protein
LFKIVKQGGSLWHFHLYIYYRMIWLISPFFLFLL